MLKVTASLSAARRLFLAVRELMSCRVIFSKLVEFLTLLSEEVDDR